MHTLAGAGRLEQRGVRIGSSACCVFSRTAAERVAHVACVGHNVILINIARRSEIPI